MNNDLTEIVVILDRSGSMRPLTKETISGYNSFMDSQRKEPGEVKVTTVFFDDQYEILGNGVNLNDLKPLDDTQYYARGWTALLDAVGKTINEVGGRLNNTPEDQRPGKVLVVITTDGEENYSKEFTKTQIKEMVTEQETKYNWKFIFLGANIDSATVSHSYGIGTTSNYSATGAGTRSVFETLSGVTASYRIKGEVDKDWNKDIQ